MAGWIAWFKGLCDTPEVRTIAELCAVSPEQAAGHLMRFWEWCDDNVPDAGTADGAVEIGVTDLHGFVDDIARRPGFATAMARVRWLAIEPPCLVLPNFLRRNGTTAKGRLGDAKRKRKQRALSDDSIAETQRVGRQRDGPVRENCDNPVTVERDTHVTKNRDQRREEKRREEKSAPAPAALSSNGEVARYLRDELGIAKADAAAAALGDLEAAKELEAAVNWYGGKQRPAWDEAKMQGYFVSRALSGEPVPGWAKRKAASNGV